MMDEDPWAEGRRDPSRSPYEANQAIPTLLFRRGRERFDREFPELAVREMRWLSLLAYPLSGGFRAWSLMPRPLVRPVLRLERLLAPAVGRFMALRMFVVIDRLPDAP